MTALPSQIPEKRRDNVHAAVTNGDNVGNDLVYIRILGYLIHFVPTDLGLRVVVTEIVSAGTDCALLDVGKMYYDHYLRTFRANKGRTPTPSNHASRPSFDTVAHMINDTLDDAPQSHSTAKKHALIRDRYRCVVTGTYDIRSILDIRELKETFGKDRSVKTDGTQCAHIFSESTNSDIEPGSEKRDYAATMWAVMSRFGCPGLPDELNGSKVHRLENVMTVVPKFHLVFDLLKAWLVATNVENKYKLEAAEPFILNEYPEYVTFTTPDPVKYPVPSPAYLAIHAACAQVAHLSGAGACIDKFHRDMDDSTTLDPDGASAEMLEHAIFELQAAGHPVTA
ncbi:hypothetical protein B0H34DRAFT_785840 [Crassisporium funariophilum]|nr:hypothetical protein B0H34DRAFT_785840 [Crassisporium funariophilum]